MKMENDLITRSTDRLQEISMKLEQSHLVYLQTDDSPLKLQQRHKLEGYIKEYLCLVPNENKYAFQETADILHRSAATLQDFSGYRAVTAWSAISLYAANLLAQPWRKEYKTLRTYSGYYKHEVEANLIGAELMFEQMGYKHTGLGVLTLEGPIDPDKVSSVSRDAIVASVECQILKQIWESVSQNYTISWLEVLEFRENHVGTPEQAIRALNYRFLEKMHQNHSKQDCYRDYYYPSPVNPEPVSAPLSYQIMPRNYGMTMPACQSEFRYIESANLVPGNYRYLPSMDQGLANRCNTYGCLPLANKCYPNLHANPYCTTLPARATRVPTDRLIEFDMPVPVTNYDKSHSRKSPRNILNLDEIELYRSSESDYDYGKFGKKPVAQKDTHDSWDFVYKNLESQGYSKDFGNREDILRKKDTEPRTAKKSNRPLEADDKNAYRFDKRRTGRTEVNDVEPLTNERLHHETLPFKKKSSSFDLTDSCHSSPGNEHVPSAHGKEIEHSSQTLPMRLHSSAEAESRIADTLKNLSLSQSAESSVQGQKWSCGTCTYLNVRGKDICEMCGKSRRKGNEDKPLASGGKECPQCTLVNEKDVSMCDACGTSLKDSPTYI